MAELSELVGPASNSSYTSIFSCIERGLFNEPSKTAIISRHQAANHLSDLIHKCGLRLQQESEEKFSCLRWTYAQFNAVSLALAEGLTRKGLYGESAVVVTFIPNSVEWLLLLSATTLAKCGLACLDAGLLEAPRRAELKSKLSVIRPSCTIVADEQGAQTIDTVLQEEGTSNTIKISLVQTSFSEHKDWSSLSETCIFCTDQAAKARLEAARHDNLDRTALIVYTSGTSSGNPKACIRHVQSMISNIPNLNWSLPGEESNGRRILQTANFRIIAPMCAFCAWRDGATIVMSGPKFTPESFLNALEQERVTDAAIIPAQIHAVVAIPDFKNRDLSDLRLILSGGDIVTSALVEFVARHFPGAKFATAHGMSECGGVFRWPYWDGIDSIPFYHGVSPLGYPNSDVRIRLIADGQVVPRGQAGELHISHGSLLKSYLGQMAATPEFYVDVDRKWFRTGDLGVINPAGDMYIVGRIKDVIKRAAVSIAPATIESCLHAYTGSQTAVVGLPHPELGQQPFAILESFNGKTETDLARHVREVNGVDSELGGAVELKTLGFDAFPTNATGKIAKLELVAALTEKGKQC